MTRANAIYLSRFPLVFQGISHLSSGFEKSVVLFGTAFYGAGFQTARTQRVDDQLPQRLARLRAADPGQGVGEADAIHFHFLAFQPP